MAKQLNVSLAFTADTREAKAQLQDLQRQLNNILKTPSNKLGITDEIREAISATAELSSRLQQATNVNTGNLDFSKFNNSLKQSGQSLSSYGQQLQKLGPTGQQAFLTLTKSIATAEIPIKRTNALVKEFTTTLANTARWQVSSSVLHGLMGSMQSAYRYAQDLNESLNDIRIVTGQSVDQMARFAAEANAAAKALSATTVEYTNASLIYYQQGLSDQQVKERTNITMKMANVSKQSAEVVSEQMTAVWNNFYNGSKSLEYYADVMTALGAATASSADEIAGGLEKFAAIGETIGLSYEYAASALATITSNTRQSEEVVGTALKTIFARIQGLNLGDTLDDGTTLNKYSAALEKVGISIFDSAGELKRMDNILDEMGAKWETLNKAQQTALAQTVAGTRQYTQLVALMDNWDKGDSDSMKANLSTAYGSSGALQEQADIYAESWEAARDRVTAAAEKIYGALLNDDFFIDMLNGFEKILTFVSQLVDNLGGLQGVLLALGAIVTKVFSAQLSQGLTNMAYNIKMMTKSGRESVEKERRDFIDNAVNSIPQNTEYTTDVEKAQQESLRTELTLQAEYMDNAERMSSIEAETNKKLIERTKLLREQTVELQKQKEQVDKRVSDGVMDLRTDISAFNMENRQTGKPLSYNDDIQPEISNIKSAAAVQAELKDLSVVIELVAQKSDKGKAALADIRKALEGLDTSADKDIARLVKEINQLGDSPDPEQLRQKLEALNLELEETIKISKQNIKDVVSPEAGKKVDALTQDLREQAQAVRDVRVANQEAKQSQEDTSKSIAGATGAQKQWSDVMVESANVAFNVASAISMVSSAIDTLKDPDVSGMQKLVTVLSTMGMVLPTIISLIGTMKKLFSSETVAKIANAAATWAQVAAEKKYNETKGEGSEITKKSIKETWQDTVWKSTKKESQDKYIEQVLKDKGYVRDQKTGGWGKTTVGKNGAKRFDPSTVISDDDAIKMATPDAQKMAGKGAFKALGSKIASSVMIAAGIAVIIGTVAMAIDQMTKAEQAVAKAKDGAKVLAENYDTAKASYDNLMSAQSQYETATNGLDGLTKGTVAYQEALLQANEAASELLATNKDLTYTIENGQIVIDKDSLEQVKANELKKVESAQAAKIAGQQELIEAEENLKKRDVARNLNTKDDDATHAGNTLAAGAAGAAAGALIGSAIPIIGTALGAIVGGLVGVIGGAITTAVVGSETEAESDALEKLEKAYLEDDTILQKVKDGSMTDEEWKKIGIEDSSLIQSLEANGAEVAALVEEMAANTAAINAQNDLVASNVLADNEAVQNSEYKDQIIDIAGDAYGHAYDKAMESEWVDTWGKKGIAQINGANKEAKKVFEEYLKYAGLEGQGYTLTDTTGNDKNRKFVYEDAQGNEHEVSLEAMQAARAAYEASATLDESATKLAETFTKLADSSNEADQALLSFVSAKNFEDATKGELEDMKEEVGTVEQNEDGTYTQESLDNIKAYLEKTFGESLTDDVAIRYGYESAEVMIQAFATKMADADEAWEDIADNYSQTVKKSLRKLEEDDALDNLSLNEVEKFGKALQQAFNTSGQEGIDTLASMLAEVGEYSDEFANAINGIDWNNATVNDLEIALENAGVECNFTTEQLENLINVMSDGTMVFEKATEIYKQFHDIIDDLEIGDTVSTEDFTILKETFGSQMTDYFMQMADGSYKLVSDAKEFYDLVNSYTIENFEKTIDNLNVVKEEINNLLTNYNEDSIQNKSHNGKWWQFGAQGSEIEGYNKDQAQAQYDFLKNSGYSDEDQMAEWREGIENGTITIAQLNTMQKAVEENAGSWNQLTEAQQLNNEQINQAQETLASTATSVGELNDMLITGRINTEEYDKALQSIMNKEFEAEDLDPDAANDVADAFREMADAGVEGMEALRDDEEAVKDATVRYMELNEAIEDIYDNYEDYVDVLKAAKKASTPIEKANLLNEKSAKSLRKSLAGLLGTTEDLIDADLMAAINPKDFEAAANGNAEAIERIRNQFIDLQAQMYGCEGEADAFKQRLAELADGAYIDLNTDPFLNALIQAAVQAGATSTDIQNMLKGFSIDADVTPFTEELWQATQNAQAAGKNIANATSFTTEVETSDVDASSEVELPQYQEVASAQTRVMGYNQVPLGNGFTAAIFPSVITTTSKRVDTSTVPQTIEKTETAVGQSVTTGDGNTSKGGVIVKNAHKATTASKTPSASNTSRAPVGSKGGGGGGSNPKAPSKIDKRDMTQKSDVVQRYREIDDSIDNVTDALTRADQAASRLWGKDKINAMKEENKLLKQQYKLIQDKAEQAREYAEEDYAELMRTASEAGISLVVDRATGDITNIEDGLDTLYDRLESAEKEYNKKVEEYNNAVLAATKSDGTVSESDSKRLETMKEALDAYEEDFIGGIEDDIEAVQNAEKQFQESVETWEQAGLDMESILDSIMQNNYDIIMEGLEIPLSLNEEDLRYIELKLSQIEDDMYSMSEAVALTSSELSEYKDNLRLADEALAELNRAHEAGEITDAAYQEGLGEIRDKYYDNVEALMELDTTMKEYYSNTLDMANEELSKYTEQMEHQTSVLEHYQSLIELMGKSADYKMIGKILEGQVETTKNSMEVSKQWYETQRNNADALAAEYAAALANNASEAELEIIKANWEAAEASANEAQDQMLSDAEAWAEALKAVLENELADLSQTLENALTGGTSFDTLTTQMERAASLQEEYLTTTNQIYETNKLMRTAQQEIDKTTNAVAKKKLKAYINETEQLQNQSKLSQYELEIQQAKYNLLLAEIALQEAQDAKSTVRLQRDSEGNFGYVYTADSNKINEAQQKLEDAQNDLYNKGLDGANDYAQKYQQTMQEMYDTLADIQQRHLDGEYETEAEYHAAMEEAKAYYYQKLQDYSSLYSVAVTADSRVVADAWSTDFASMIYDTDNWKQAVEDYTDDAIAAFTKWQNAVTGEGGIADLIGNSVEDVGKTVQEVTDKSKELAKKTQEEVIPALDKELDSVNNLTGAYAKMRDTIKETIEYYTNMINRINNSQTSDWNSGSEGSDDSSIPEDGGSGNDGGNSEAIPGGQDDGQGEGSPDTIPGGSPDGEGGSGISYHSGTLKFSGSGANRVWTDASGKTYAYGSPEQKAFQKAFDKAYGRNGGYKGDYWIGWSGDGGKLNADVLHEKYGLATGGYTGDWAGSYGKLAFLHQKELVLNAQDTENFLASMEVMERILQVIDMQSANAQLGGILSSPGFNSNNSQVIEQSVHIEASFPGVQDRSEIEEAFNNLINKASQYANRK